MEYARRCTVCGKIYCYTDQDLKNNQENAFVGAASAIGAIASIFGGTTYQTFEFNKMSDRSLDKIKDYNKCPNCGSSSTVVLTSDELETYRNNEPVNINANPQMISINTNASPESLVERGMLFLEDQEWDKANIYFENALDADPKNVRAYIGKLLGDLHLSKEELLISCEEDFTDNPNYKKALRFSTEQEKEQLESINKERIYKIAKEVSRTDLKRAIEFLDPIKDYKDVSQLIDSYTETIKSNDYETALSARESQSIFQLSKAVSLLEKLGDYRESKKVVAEYQRRIEALKEEQSKRQQTEAQKAAALEEERAKQAAKEAEIIRQQRRKREKRFGIASVAVIAIIAIAVIAVKTIVPMQKYNTAVTLMENGEYEAAIEAFDELGNYKDSAEQKTEARKASVYAEAESLFENERYEEALSRYIDLADYKDSSERVETIQFLLNKQYSDYLSSAYIAAAQDFPSAGEYLDRIPDSYRPANSLREIYQRYSPYSGVFDLNGEEFRSEFTVSNDNKVKWHSVKMDDSYHVFSIETMGIGEWIEVEGMNVSVQFINDRGKTIKTSVQFSNNCIQITTTNTLKTYETYLSYSAVPKQ